MSEVCPLCKNDGFSNFECPCCLKKKKSTSGVGSASLVITSQKMQVATIKPKVKPSRQKLIEKIKANSEDLELLSYAMGIATTHIDAYAAFRHCRTRDCISKFLASRQSVAFQKDLAKLLKMQKPKGYHGPEQNNP